MTADFREIRSDEFKNAYLAPLEKVIKNSNLSEKLLSKRNIYPLGDAIYVENNIQINFNEKQSALKKNKRAVKGVESDEIDKVNPEFNDNDKLFDNEIVDGWVKPGQVTALIGASGAGNTTLLNALSERLKSGVITFGVRMVNGHELDASFQRSISHVQQQDLHIQTSTVRETLKFSEYLRQPKLVSRPEKDSYVNYIISLFEMENYSDAVVGVSGEGLNVEQHKRLTIGVELLQSLSCWSSLMSQLSV